MKILSLSAQNVLRLEEVELTLDGKSVVIGGENEQGKSATVNIIKRILESSRKLPERTLRDGAESGYDEAMLDNGMRIRREYLADGKSKITVVTADGASVKNPATFLDALFGDLSYDAVEFDAMDDEHQAATVARITGLEVDDLDAEHERLFQERTLVGREAKTAKGAADSLPEYPGGAFTDVTDLLAQQRQAQAQQDALATAHREAHAADDTAVRAGERQEEAKRALAQAEHDYTQALNRLSAANGKVKDAADAVTLDGDKIAEKIAGASTCNAQAQANATKAKAREAAKAKQAEYDGLTERLDKIAAEKQARIAAVVMPVPGMALDGGRVTLKGIPWKQCSTAERMEASIALGFAANRKLRVQLVHNGSNLDKKHLARVLEYAVKYDGQAIIERTGDGSECSVIIEDGRVKGAKKAAQTGLAL